MIPPSAGRCWKLGYPLVGSRFNPAVRARGDGRGVRVGKLDFGNKDLVESGDVT